MVFAGDISDDARIEDMKRIMSPTLTNRTALWWWNLGNLMMVKDVVDASIRHDDLGLVTLHYALMGTEVDRLFELRMNVDIEPARLTYSMSSAWRSLQTF